MAAYEAGSIIGRIKANTEGLQAGIQVAKGQLDDFVRGAQAVGQNMTKYITLPLMAAGSAAFKMSMDFEESTSKIVGLVGIAQEQVDEWSKDLLKIGPALSKGPRELAEALFFVTSAGIRGAEAMDVLEMSAKASAAGLGDTAVVADLVTSAINAYGVENLDAAHATDILVAAVREGKAEAAELTASLGKVLPIASEMEVSFDQVAAAVAAMTRTGTDAQTASTQLRAILVGLLNPSKQAEEALSAMGTSSANLRKKIKEEGLLAALMEIRELTLQYGEEAMGTVFPNIRALAGVLDLMGANAEENVAIFEALTDTTGDLDHAFETAAATARFKWNQAIARGQATLIRFGEAIQIGVLPLLNAFTWGLEIASRLFAILPTPIKAVIVVMLGLLAAIGPVLLVTAQLIKAYKTLSGSVLVVNLAMKAYNALLVVKTTLTNLATASTLALSAALKSVGIGWIIAGIAALVGALVLLVKNFDKVIEKVRSFLEWLGVLKKEAEETAEALEYTEEAITRRLEEEYEYRESLLGRHLTSQEKQEIEHNLRMEAERERHYTEAEERLGRQLTTEEKLMVEADLRKEEQAEKYQGNILDINESFIPEFEKVGQEQAEAYIDGWEDALEIESPSRVFQRMGVSVIEGMIEGVKSSLAELESLFSQIANSVQRAFKSVLRIQSPSAVFREIGQAIGDGLNQGLQQSIRPVQLAVQGATVSPMNYSVKTMDRRPYGMKYPGSPAAVSIAPGNDKPPSLAGGRLAMIIADDQVLRKLWRQLQGARYSEEARGGR